MGRSLADAENLIKGEKPFGGPADTLWAGPFNGSRGFLPEDWHASLRTARYVVYSYGTPIAWVTESGSKILPDVGYSLTTGQHQYTAASALGMTHRPQRGRPVVRASTGKRRGGIDG